MFKVWILIIFGVIAFPMISELAKKYEEKENDNEEEKSRSLKKAKYLKFTVWSLFLLIALLVAYFAAKLIPQ